MKIAVFQSHPIQHFAPLWQEIAKLPGIELTVHYYSKAGIESIKDPDFGQELKWDIDLLSGYNSDFLPRRWPTKDELDCSWKGLNSGIAECLDAGVDVAYVNGYVHINDWIVARGCRSRGIPLMLQSDSNSLYVNDSVVVMNWIKERIVRYFYRHVSIFLSVGDHNKEYHIHYGATEDRVKWCAYPVDTVRFRAGALSGDKRAALRERLGISLDAFVIAFSGKMVSWKRPQDLIEAIRILNRKNVIALMIGSGELEATIGEDSFIRKLGFVNQREMPSILSIADLLVMPSSYENLGMSVTEAQCIGIPVILSDRCGCYGPHDVFRDGETGYLYPCGDVTALSRCIGRMMDNPEERHKMGERSHILADEHSAIAAARDFVSAAEYAILQSNLKYGQTRNMA